MSLLGIIALVLLGIILLLIEFFAIPGTTITGILGMISIGFAVFSAYKYHPAPTGHVFLIGSFVVLVVAMVFAFRAKTWERISLSASLEGNVNEIREMGIEVGDEGKTITRMNPVGKVMVENQVFEARSEDGFIAENNEVVIKKILNTQLIVTLKSK